MRVVDVVCSVGATGFFSDDQRAIKAGATHDGFFYAGEPVTPGFRAVRQAGESISVMLLLEDGRLACGDCAAVQYAGAGGRDDVFLAERYLPLIRDRIAPLLRGRSIESFRGPADEIDALEGDGRRLHTAVRYGLTQAILAAASCARRMLPCEVIADEYGLPLVPEPVKIFVQSGDDRHDNVDKMIIKQVDVLPHGLINSIPEKLGEKGEKLLAYIAWLRDRICERRYSPDYEPILHVDVYGTVGIIFEERTDAMADYLARLGEAAAPFALRIEGPMDAGGREAQCAALGALREALTRRGTPVEIVADEWCNTVEDIRLFADRGAADMIQIKTPDLGGIQHCIDAVLYCRERGVGAYLGGTCNETDVSARHCVHVALATRPDQVLAKPGMGVDEGFMIVRNEMQRALAVLRAKGATDA